MNNSTPKLLGMTTDQDLINLIVELGYPGKTGDGITLYEDHLFFNVITRRETYQVDERNRKLATENKTSEVNKENKEIQLQKLEKRTKKANATVDKTDVDVSAFAAETGVIFVPDGDTESDDEEEGI